LYDTVIEFDEAERFCKKIGKLLSSGSEEHSDLLFFNHVANEVEMNLEVFCLAVILWILRNFDGALIVTIYGYWASFYKT